MNAVLTVERAGPLTTVQDDGRTGLAALGIGRSGPCDRRAFVRANRLVGNPPGTAALEVTFGGLTLRADADVVLALTGARCPDLPYNAVFTLAAGAALRLAPPTAGLRTYLAVRGGLDVEPVLGSASTDLLSGLGPDPVEDGRRLRVGPPPDLFPNVDVAAVAEPESGDVVVSLLPGPRDSWLSSGGWSTLLHERFEVTSESNRVGIRLEGTALERERAEELRSEGMARGAVQVPPSGKPVLFLADHPVTGGYPVVGYVLDGDVDRCAQLCPGQRLRFRPARRAAPSGG